MNPLFGRMTPNMMGGMGGNPMQNVMNALNQIRQMQQNPNGLADLLLQKGKINQQQYEQIKGYNPQQIGQYLIQSGSMARQDVDDAYNNAVQPIQNALNGQK